MRRIVVSLSCAALVGCPSTEPTTGSGHDTTTSAPGLTTIEPDATTSGGASSPGDPTTGVDGTTGAPTTSSPPTTAPDATTGDDPGTTGGPSPGTTTGTTTTGDDTTAGDTTAEGTTTGGASTPQGCPEIYAQDILPTFELEIAPNVLTALTNEWVAADDDDLAKHELAAFKYQDIVITDASIRLRGNPDHWPTQGKMQFEIEFNTFDKKGRFMGLRQILFDAAEYNKSFLRDRLALSILRDAGLAAPCANNARLVLNGEYYGLFTSIEKVDREFLERHFEDPDGNLYKRGGGSLGWSKKTNDDDDDTSDIKKLVAAKDLDDLLAVMNLEQAILEWAAEAVIPDRDGLWAGGLNGYTYNDPETGFNMIPWDLDDSFTRLPPDVDPVTFKKPPEVFHGRPYYDIALADPVWFQKYVDAVDHVLTTAYQVEVLQQRIDAWSAQIAAAAADDPNKPFSTKDFHENVKDKREFVADRAEFLAEWMQCWKDGGQNQGGVCVPP